MKKDKVFAYSFGPSIAFLIGLLIGISILIVSYEDFNVSEETLVNNINVATYERAIEMNVVDIKETEEVYNKDTLTSIKILNGDIEVGIKQGYISKEDEIKQHNKFTSMVDEYEELESVILNSRSMSKIIIYVTLTGLLISGFELAEEISSIRRKGRYEETLRISKETIC